MAQENDASARNRRSFLKSISAASLGVGGLVAAGSGTAAAADEVQACDDSTAVYYDCDEFPDHKGYADLYECGDKIDECVTPNGNTMYYVDWHDYSQPDGWFYQGSLCDMCQY
jgi:hypothetical protein